jgi:hypothetical protein
MPWIVPLLPALIGAGVAGTTTGLQAAGTFSPSTTKATEQQQLLQQEQQQKTQQQQEQQLFKHFAPDAQGQTGGALGDASLSSMIAELSGSPGDINLAQQTVFGTSPGTASSPVGGG